MTNGPGYVAAQFDIHNSKRSPGSIALLEKTGYWDPENVGKFMPERWLSTDEERQVIFNSRAGPSQPFGAGPRSCFGMLPPSLRDLFSTDLVANVVCRSQARYDELEDCDCSDDLEL